MVRRPRLRTILLGVNLVILALPLGGVWALRLYESALVRQTESELVAQGAFVAAGYRAALGVRESIPGRGGSIGDDERRPAMRRRAFRPATGAGMDSRTPREALRGRAARIEEHGRPLDPGRAPAAGGGELRPRPPVLDLAVDPVRPPRPDPLPAPVPADPEASAAGAAVEPALRDAAKVTLAGIRVVDANGVVVASSAGDLGLSMAHHEEVSRALSGEDVSLLRERISDEPAPPLASLSRGTRVRVFVAMPIVESGRVLGAVVLSRTPRDIGQALYGKRAPLLVSAVLLLGVVLLISVVTSFAISRPVDAVIDQTERAVRGEKGAVAPLERPVTREIARLSEAVAAMARTLEQRADYIRGFASRVSHEFKTPLTAIRGAVELVREHGESMSEAERSRFLANVTEDAERLERLVRRLLELARADVAEPDGGRASLREVVGRVAERHRRAGLPVAVELGDGSDGVAMGEEALDAVLSSLLDNARQHGGDGVRASVRATPGAAGHVRILVADDGRGISPGNASRVFEPFFTTARKEGGTGLGLAVSRALVTAHRGVIALVPSARGATFEIVLPRR